MNLFLIQPLENGNTMFDQQPMGINSINSYLDNLIGQLVDKTSDWPLKYWDEILLDYDTIKKHIYLLRKLHITLMVKWWTSNSSNWYWLDKLGQKAHFNVIVHFFLSLYTYVKEVNLYFQPPILNTGHVLFFCQSFGWWALPTSAHKLSHPPLLRTNHF